jgi:molecular chaperone GrpE
MADTPNATSAPEAAEIDAIRNKLNATESELNNYKLRLADFENARKRLLRDAEVERKYASESLARDLLAVLDNLDRALSAAKTAGETGPLASGVSATASQFLDILRRHGVKKIECTPGTAFDPNLHQAVMEQPSEEFKPGQIVQVLEQGFVLHDRVLRAASVIVAAPPS